MPKDVQVVLLGNYKMGASNNIKQGVARPGTLQPFSLT